MEFRGYRPYSIGDDPALVDWRVFARTDRHYLKTFEQETNLECHLLIDSSSSMGFTGGAALTKLEFASYFAAALAWLIVRGSDHVSLQIFDEKIRGFLPPGSTRRHLHQLLGTLERNQAGGQTSLPAALTRASLQLRRRGALIVISDFYDDPGTIFTAMNSFIHRGFRIHLVHLLSPEEMELGTVRSPATKIWNRGSGSPCIRAPWRSVTAKPFTLTSPACGPSPPSAARLFAHAHRRRLLAALRPRRRQPQLI